MTFRGRLRKARKPIQLIRVQDVACTFQATIGGIITPGMMTKDVSTTITTCNTVVTDAVGGTLQDIGVGRFRILGGGQGLEYWGGGGQGGGKFSAGT